jgi:hypothetical protein
MGTNKIYKYYRFDQCGYWKAPFERQELYFSTFDTLNDSYEFFFKYNLKGSLNEKIQYLKKNFPNSSYVSSLDSNEKIDRFFENINLDVGFYIAKKTFKNIGICSFSSKPDIILMWSHYANGNSGFCLEFDLIYYLNTPKPIK